MHLHPADMLKHFCVWRCRLYLYLSPRRGSRNKNGWKSKSNNTCPVMQPKMPDNADLHIHKVEE